MRFTPIFKLNIKLISLISLIFSHVFEFLLISAAAQEKQPASNSGEDEYTWILLNKLGLIMFLLMIQTEHINQNLKFIMTSN